MKSKLNYPGLDIQELQVNPDFAPGINQIPLSVKSSTQKYIYFNPRKAWNSGPSMCMGLLQVSWRNPSNVLHGEVFDNLTATS